MLLFFLLPPSLVQNQKTDVRTDIGFLHIAGNALGSGHRGQQKVLALQQILDERFCDGQLLTNCRLLFIAVLCILRVHSNNKGRIS